VSEEPLVRRSEYHRRSFGRCPSGLSVGIIPVLGLGLGKMKSRPRLRLGTQPGKTKSRPRPGPVLRFPPLVVIVSPMTPTLVQFDATRRRSCLRRKKFLA
jgi:hypothetical protein